MSNGWTYVAVAISLAGCKMSLNGRQFEYQPGTGMVDKTAQEEAAQARSKEEAAAAEAARKEQAAREDAERAALAEKAKTEVRVSLPALGLTVAAPGDVTARNGKPDRHGDNPMIVEGATSRFYLLVANAARDHYDHSGWLNLHKSLHDRFSVIRSDGAGKSWDFEYSYDVQRERAEYVAYQNRWITHPYTERYLGYFSRRVVNGVPYNCTVEGLTSIEAVKKAQTACSSLGK